MHNLESQWQFSSQNCSAIVTYIQEILQTWEFDQYSPLNIEVDWWYFFIFPNVIKYGL